MAACDHVAWPHGPKILRSRFYGLQLACFVVASCNAFEKVDRIRELCNACAYSEKRSFELRPRAMDRKVRTCGAKAFARVERILLISLLTSLVYLVFTKTDQQSSALLQLGCGVRRGHDVIGKRCVYQLLLPSRLVKVA